MQRDLQYLLANLIFHADYYGEKQKARLDAHLSQGKTIASFTYDEKERQIDELISQTRQAHEALTKLTEEQVKKPFWTRFIK